MNIAKLREETPGAKKVLHFNNAGASLIPKTVYNSIDHYLNYELLNGGYESADHFRDQLELFYANVGNLINASPNEIAFQESATHAWDAIFFSLPLNRGDRILTARVEYASNYIAYLQLQKRLGVEVIPIDSIETGEIDLEKLEEEASKSNTALISITHIPTNGGIVNPAEEVGVIANKYGIPYLLDACQSVGQYPIDVKKIGCDFLTATGRKYLRGPRGTGFLYVNEKHLASLEPFALDLHSAQWTQKDKYEIRSDAKRFEKWECNPALKLGLSEAARYCTKLGIENIWDRVKYLAELFRSKLNAIDGVRVIDLGKLKSGIVTFVTPIDPEIIGQKLFENGINTSQLDFHGTVLDMSDRNLTSGTRASVHYYNTEEEIKRFIDVLTEILHDHHTLIK